MIKNILTSGNRIFLWIALATGLLLLIPYFLMYFKVPTIDPGSATQDGMNWTVSDFVVMGILIFSSASLFVLSARKIEARYRFGVAVGFILLFLYLWAELAVGIFTNWGS